jgi:hypothetical protein
MSDNDVGRDDYHLILKGQGVVIDKMVNARQAGSITQIAFGAYSVEPPTEVMPPQSLSVPLVNRMMDLKSPSSGQRLSLREYLQNADVDRGIHGKILAVGRYVRDYENQSDFSREDIRARFRSAGESQPANFHRDFQKAVRAGWIAEDHQNRDRFYVTRTGDDEIDRRQGQTLNSKPARPRRRVKRLPQSNEGEE